MRMARPTYLYCAGLLLAVITLALHFLVLNLSPSMPVGLYLKTGKANASNLKTGDLVLACLPPEIKKFGLARGYLGKASICQGADAVIKQIYGVPGDDLTLTMKGMITKSAYYIFPTKVRDSQNRPLPYISRGAYNNTTGYWLIGTNSPDSWDARYWGPVPLTNILSHVKPLVVFPGIGEKDQPDQPIFGNE